MTDNTFRFQGKTWRLSEINGAWLHAEEAPPAKPDVLSDRDAEIEAMRAEMLNSRDSNAGPVYARRHAHAIINAALKLMREDSKDLLDSICKLEARIAELEKIT